MSRASTRRRARVGSPAKTVSGVVTVREAMEQQVMALVRDVTSAEEFETIMERVTPVLRLRVRAYLLSYLTPEMRRAVTRRR